MDLEPLVRLLRGDRAVHGLSHTYAGATVLGLVSLLVGRPLGVRLLRLWPPTPGHSFLGRLRGTGGVPWPAAVAGAFVGTFSHVLLDSVMHAEMRPLWPAGGRNALLGVVSMEALHLLCLAAGAVGVIGLAVRYRGGEQHPVTAP